MRKYDQLKKDLLKDKEIKKTYEELGPEFVLIRLIVKKRIERGLTQKELAQEIGTKQSSISRLESGKYNPTLQFLVKISKALDANLEISIR